jgi:hypothetical protein
VPTAVAGDKPLKISIGVVSEPPPIPVKPMSNPTTKPMPTMPTKIMLRDFLR